MKTPDEATNKWNSLVMELQAKQQEISELENSQLPFPSQELMEGMDMEAYSALVKETGEKNWSITKKIIPLRLDEARIGGFLDALRWAYE